MPETRQLPLAEACSALGISRRTALRRLADGTLQGAKSEGKWLVDVQVGANAQPDTRARAETERANAELAHARELLAEVRADRDRLATLAETLTHQLERADVERAELRRLLSQAQGLLLPAPANPVSTPDLTSPRPRWAFWRR